MINYVSNEACMMSQFTEIDFPVPDFPPGTTFAWERFSPVMTGVNRLPGFFVPSLARERTSPVTPGVPDFPVVSLLKKGGRYWKSPPP